MPEYVIDTNVILSADGKHADVCAQGVTDCAQRLLIVSVNGGLVLDDGERIIGEYLNKTRPWNPQTAGEQFVKWVLDNKHDIACCASVSITPKVDDPEDFDEFPADLRLATFERADRKFVATACAREGQPPIVVAMDTDYYMPDHRAAFAACGVHIDFICEPDLARVYNRKYGEG